MDRIRQEGERTIVIQREVPSDGPPSQEYEGEAIIPVPDSEMRNKEAD
jgi:hypothetical protein